MVRVPVRQSLLLLLTSLMALYGQEPTPLRLRDAIDQALARNPQLAAAAGRIAAAEGQRQQAALAPNPRLILQSENTRFFGAQSFAYPRDTDNFAYLSQIFESAGKRQRRTEFAAAGVHAAESERDLLARQIAFRVATAYWTAAGAVRVRDLLAETVRNFEGVVEYHRNRVREGALAEVDLIRIELERDRLLISAQTAANDVEQARLALIREIGVNDHPPILFIDALDDVREIVPAPVDVVLQARPETRVARQGVTQAQANLRLQQANAKPDPEALFGYKRTAGFDTVLGGFQINLPLWNRNQGLIAAAEAGIRTAEANQSFTETQVRAEYAAAVRNYETRYRQLTVNLQPMRGRAIETARIAQAAYREGGTDLLRLLDAERVRIETEVLYYRTLADYQQSVVTLRVAQGEMP